jgi:hypothetical protein
MTMTNRHVVNNTYRKVYWTFRKNIRAHHHKAQKSKNKFSHILPALKMQCCKSMRTYTLIQKMQTIRIKRKLSVFPFFVVCKGFPGDKKT